VRLLFRAPRIRWLTRSARLHAIAPLRSLLYAPADVGPAGLSRVVSAPELFRRLPLAAREKAIRRCTRPAAAAWLIDRTDDVATDAEAELRSVTADGGRVRIDLAKAPAIEADHVLTCTGYAVDLSRYGFVAPELLASIKSVKGFPVLGRGMTSSVEGLHVVGWPATATYGPLMRHIAGVDFSSRAVTGALLSGNATTPGRFMRRPSQYHFDAESYLAQATSSIPHYRELQRAVADATRSVNASSVLDLGIGTGETAAAVMQIQPHARLTGVDMSAGMLAVAATRLAQQAHVELLVGKLQDRLPEGEFDLVVSSLAVHHLSRSQKRRLFGRIQEKLQPGGCFVMADIVRPATRADAVTPTSRLYDRPESAADLERWLGEAGFTVGRCWTRGDLAVFRAQKASCTPIPSTTTQETASV
jgi:tRNA (cmo5U34)-methyltransferase